MRVVLNTTTPFPTLNYLLDADYSLTLAFACRVDAAVAIVPLADYPSPHYVGAVVSYADVTAFSGTAMCVDGLSTNAFAWNTACIQAGFDSGKGYEYPRPTGLVSGVDVGQNCVARDVYLEDCGFAAGVYFSPRLVNTTKPAAQRVRCQRIPSPTRDSDVVVPLGRLAVDSCLSESVMGFQWTRSVVGAVDGGARGGGSVTLPPGFPLVPQCPSPMRCGVRCALANVEPSVARVGFLEWVSVEVVAKGPVVG